jgi:hypothetical protein
MGGACATFAAVLAAVTGCQQPTGLVVSVFGATVADELRLTVGTRDAEAAQPRFLRQDDLVLPRQSEPYPDGFEIYLDRQDLLAESAVAVVLDAVITDGEVDILRDSYVIVPELDSLLEVRLTPQGLGTGQWVCSGRAGEMERFTITSPRDLDCDRDGWLAGDDPDDADPRITGMPRFADALGRCAVALGGNLIELFARGAPCSPCDPREGLEKCLESLPRTRCMVRGTTASFSVDDLVGDIASNPEWELAKLAPQSDLFSATFVPTNRAPDQWRAVFARAGSPVNTGWFSLRDRVRGDVTLIEVTFAPPDGEEARCELAK